MQRFRVCPVIFKSRAVAVGAPLATACMELQVERLYFPYRIQLPMTALFLNAELVWLLEYQVPLVRTQLSLCRDVFKVY
jgi:hypothetical protein